MAGRTSLEIKKRILEALQDGNSHTYSELEIAVNTNWQTVRSHCKELEIFGCIRINPSTPKSKAMSIITITKQGMQVLQRL